MSTLKPPSHTADTSNIIADHSLRHSLAGALDAVEGTGFYAYVRVPQVVGETAAITMHSILIVLAVSLFTRQRLNGNIPRISVGLACLVMYGIAVAHWARGIRDYMVLQNDVLKLQEETFYCLYNITIAQPCTLTSDGSQELDNPIYDGCLEAGEILVTMTLADMIVVWRAWVLWSRNRMVQAISIALVCLTLVIGSLSARYTCKVGAVSGDAFVIEKFGLVAWILSWATNIWSTGLISYKAWQYRRTIRKDLQLGAIRTRLEKVMILFVDSGILYCGLWTIIVAYGTVLRLTVSNHVLHLYGTKRGFVDVMLNLTQSSLLEVVSMYPTLLTVLVVLAKSSIERTILPQTLPLSPDDNVAPRRPDNTHIRNTNQDVDISHTGLSNHDTHDSELILGRGMDTVPSDDEYFTCNGGGKEGVDLCVV